MFKKDKDEEKSVKMVETNLTPPSAVDTAEVKVPSSGSLIAKKDFLIVHNDYRREIKKGDDLSDVPEIYHPNLRTEEVL